MKRILYVNEDEYRNNLTGIIYDTDYAEVLAYSDIETAKEAGLDFNLFAIHPGLCLEDGPVHFAEMVRRNKPDALIVAISNTGLTKERYLEVMKEFSKGLRVFDDLLERAPEWKEDIDNLVAYLNKIDQN